MDTINDLYMLSCVILDLAKDQYKDSLVIDSHMLNKEVFEEFEKTPQEIYDEIEMILSAEATSVTDHERSVIIGEETEGVDKYINTQTYVEGEEDAASGNSLFRNLETKDELATLKTESAHPNATTENNNLITEATVSNEGKVLEKTLFDEFNNFELPEDNEDEKKTIESESVLENEENVLVSPKDEEEYTFSELEDTNYFSLEEFLKKLDSQKEE